jgi:hypothetical protein
MRLASGDWSSDVCSSDLQQITFGILFKYLKSKGLYILEDLHTSDKYPWMTEEDEISTLNMLNQLKNNQTMDSNHLHDDEKNYIIENVESIEIWSPTQDFSNSITSFIYKK